jgi:hypothetical protein
MIRNLVKDEKIEFLAIQETKLQEVSASLCYSIWGGEDCGWAFNPSIGNSGGILSIWRKSVFSFVFSFVGTGYVGVCLDWGAQKKRCYIVNVYSKCDLTNKRRLWESILMSKGGFGGEAWCVIGDFNAVLHGDERRGINLHGLNDVSVESAEFANFVSNMELLDLPVLGRKFTWFHPNGQSMSRIDRALVSEGWMQVWGQSSLWVLPRSVSDHCPLILRCGSVDWGPRPFRFNNHWLKNDDFQTLIEGAWRESEVVGWMGYILKEKLKGLKAKIKVWNKEVYGGVDLKISQLIEDIGELDVRGELEVLTEGEVSHRKHLFGVLWQLLRSKESLLSQRARVKWLREGDANSAYFHACLKARGSRNFINALRVDGRWVESPSEVRREVVSYFTSQFHSSFWLRPRLYDISFPSITIEDNLQLSRLFSLDEVESIVKECDGNKSPGPDGFNFSFIKSFWYLLKDEVKIMFDQFHSNSALPKSFSSYFVTLIPKVKSPFGLNEYRPISLVGCLYKLVAKVLVARLAPVMNAIVAPTQSAFLKGRLLVDGVLVINEVVDLAKKSGKNCLIFKVDFQKAYDSVEWSFLDYMLGRFGFCDKWREWIRACVFAGSMSVFVNGSATEEINIQRGLKQGDPLAPFLFLLVAEGLGGLMKKAVEQNSFKGFEVGRNGVVVSHLQYADDTLCIGEATIENLWILKAILRSFEIVSGLKVNFSKSCVMGVNVSNDFIRLASVFLNCKVGSVPFKYLGLPVGANPRRASTWEPLLETLRQRLGRWGNKYVSLGGRIVPLNAVLNAIPIFYLSFLKIPLLVWKKVRRIQREFLWGCKGGRARISWVKWDVVCKPKKLGGLGVRDIRAVNISLLAKWRWRLLEDDNAMWKRVLRSKYGTNVM